MSSRTRKQTAHRARAQHKRDKRADKRREAKAHSKPTPRNQRTRSNVVQFPKEWSGLFQANRKARAA